MGGHVKLVRNGKEVNTVLDQKYFDFNLQSIHHKVWRLLPGDRLRGVCRYDTSNAPDGIRIGQRTEEEMCEFFFGYYPRIDNFYSCVVTGQPHGGFLSGNAVCYDG